MADVNPLLGHCDCPVCGAERAQVRLSMKSQLAYLACRACTAQVQVRSGRGDQAIRSKITAPAVTPPAAAPAAESQEAPAAPAVTSKKGQEKARDSWDVL